MAGRLAVGLDIGTSGVRAAELAFGKGPATLQRFGQVALPVGAVRDGEVADPQLVADAIKHLWSTAKFTTKRVVLGVANQKVIVRQVDLPWMPADELRKSLALQVQDFIPIPVEQAILDYHPIEEITSDGGVRSLRVLLVAASRDMVQSALDAVKRAGLTATQVDLTPFAVLRSLGRFDEVGADPSAHAGAEALVDIGAKVTNIVIHQNGVPRFVRILLMGGDNITDAVSERLGVPFDQAVGVKQQLGMAAVRGELSSDHPAARVIETAAGSFVEEVRGSLDYYLAQPGSVPLQRVVISGGGARLNGLAQRLAAATRLPVEPGAASAALRVGKTGLSADQLTYVEPQIAVPVGLALGVAS
ncbi:MAG TPA: type IV pilus assembly protein PilM [Mycobacteriales bacterium]|nr:type IV pilus assembly protein PilM [Mycobacteriales bacterium]